MPSAIVLTGRITTTAPDSTGALLIHINSDSDTVHELTGSIDGDDTALAVGPARERVLYWTLELDLGAGFETIHESEFRIRSLGGSRQDWARRCELELYGKRWNPLLTAAVRGTLPVRVTVVTGDPSQPVTLVKVRVEAPPRPTTAGRAARRGSRLNAAGHPSRGAPPR